MTKDELTLRWLKGTPECFRGQDEVEKWYVAAERPDIVCQAELGFGWDADFIRDSAPFFLPLRMRGFPSQWNIGNEGLVLFQEVSDDDDSAE